MNGVVTLRTTINGLIINMKNDCEFDSIVESLVKKVDSAGRFFNGASLNVKYKGRELTKFEEDTIHKLLLDKTGADIKCFTKYSEKEKEMKGKDKLKMKKFFFKDIEEGITKFYRGTIRSGQLIDFDGNVVIIGDINPGGEIVATGNIIVLGILRGIVHAGADGNKEAYVISLKLDPVQLRIADIITRAPDSKVSLENTLPEIAYVKDDTIYIETFLSSR
ncbi:MAG: septum site-determining protein MinC [Clostridiales bacterium]